MVDALAQLEQLVELRLGGFESGMALKGDTEQQQQADGRA